MAKKDRYQKELDLILEKLRFWRYVILGIVSGTLGLLISYSQNKLEMNLLILLVLMFAFIGIIVSIKRIDSLTKKYYLFLDFLEKEK